MADRLPVKWSTEGEFVWFHPVRVKVVKWYQAQEDRSSSYRSRSPWESGSPAPEASMRTFADAGLSIERVLQG